MSYDLYLRDPVSKDELQVPGHMMYGGNIKCDYIDGKLIPTTTTRAYLNITYNYGRYYYEAFPDRKKKKKQHDLERKKYGIHNGRGGIRILSGLSGALAIPVLEEMIRRIEAKYKPGDTWITTEREQVNYINRKTGKQAEDGFEMLTEYFKLREQGHSEEDAERILNELYEKQIEIIEMNEGSDGGSYWSETAMNAIRPLYQLIALSRMRPDGIWSEES